MQTIEANGAKIPAVGLGTWQLNGDVGSRIIEQALKTRQQRLAPCSDLVRQRLDGGVAVSLGTARDQATLTVLRETRRELVPGQVGERIAVQQQQGRTRAATPQPQLPVAHGDVLEREAFAEHACLLI